MEIFKRFAKGVWWSLGSLLALYGVASTFVEAIRWKLNPGIWLVIGVGLLLGAAFKTMHSMHKDRNAARTMADTAKSEYDRKLASLARTELEARMRKEVKERLEAIAVRGLQIGHDSRIKSGQPIATPWQEYGKGVVEWMQGAATVIRQFFGDTKADLFLQDCEVIRRNRAAGPNFCQSGSQEAVKDMASKLREVVSACDSFSLTPAASSLADSQQLIGVRDFEPRNVERA